MKQGKKLLCILLAMVMAFSCLTVAASARKDYNKPDSWSNVNKPVFSIEQGATAILDYIDGILGELNFHEEIKALGIKLFTLDIHDLDSTFDTGKEISESGLYQLADGLAGDVKELNFSIPKNSSIRRRAVQYGQNPFTELDFLLNVLQFFANNAYPLYKLLGNKIDLGVVGWFVDLDEEIPELKDIHGLVVELVYGLLIEEVDFENDPAKKAEVDAMTLDGVLQYFLDERLIKFVADMFAEVEKGVPSNPVAEFLGLPMNEDGTLRDWIGLKSDLFPSLRNNPDSTSITKTSLYQWIHNIFHALIDDVAVPYGGALILEALDLEPDDTDATELSYIDVAIGLFVTDEDFPGGYPGGMTDITSAFLYAQNCPNPTKPRAIDKMDAALKYILGSGVKLHTDGRPEGIQKFIRFEDDGQGGRVLKFDDGLANQLSSYIQIITPMLSELIPDTFRPLTKAENDEMMSLKPDEAQTEAEKKAINEKIFTLFAKYLIQNLAKEVRFSGEHECNTIRELATWTLTDVVAELLPDLEWQLDFEDKINDGEIDPDSDACLDIASVVGAYYLNGELGMNIGYVGLTFDSFLTQAFDFFLDKYAVLFSRTAYDPNKYGVEKVWHDIYDTVNQWIPLTNIVYGVQNNEAGMREIVVDKLIASILNFDIPGLFSIVGVRSNSDAEFNKSLSKIVINLLARILNGLFHLPQEGAAGTVEVNLIIPYSYSTLDQLLVLNPADEPDDLGVGLQNTAYRLISYLPKIVGNNGDASLMRTSADLIAEILQIIDLDNFEYMQVKFRDEAPAGLTHSINELRTLYNRLAPVDNEGKKYYEDGYGYFHMVDFTPWVYQEYRSALSSARSLLEQQEKALAGEDVAPDRKDITFAYYALSQYEIMIQNNRRFADDYYLDKTMNKYNDADAYPKIHELIAEVEKGTQGSGQQVYTQRTFDAFKNAWNFAKKVEAEYERLNASKRNEIKQSKINTARSELIDAIRELKAWTPLANYSDLDSAMNRILTTDLSPSLCSTDTVNKVVDVFKKAKILDRDYDVDSQKVIDDLTDDLQKALNNLEAKSHLEFENTNEQFINFDKKYLFGLGFDFRTVAKESRFSRAFTRTYATDVVLGSDTDGNDLSIGLKQNANGAGTGSMIQLYYENNEGENVIVDGYEIVIFGDMNGDCVCNGMDAVIMKMYSGFMLEKDLTAESVYTAGDVNNDGTVGNEDSKIASEYGIGIEDSYIDQCPDSVKSAALTFADLLA